MGIREGKNCFFLTVSSISCVHYVFYSFIRYVLQKGNDCEKRDSLERKGDSSVLGASGLTVGKAASRAQGQTGRAAQQQEQLWHSGDCWEGTRTDNLPKVRGGRETLVHRGDCTVCQNPESDQVGFKSSQRGFIHQKRGKIFSYKCLCLLSV